MFDNEDQFQIQYCENLNKEFDSDHMERLQNREKLIDYHLKKNLNDED